MDMSRIRIEGLLAAFPKLVGSGKQHTYVETENVRYVYQPIEVSCLLAAAAGRVLAAVWQQSIVCSVAAAMAVGLQVWACAVRISTPSSMQPASG
jgi:hypothetical protein